MDRFARDPGSTGPLARFGGRTLYSWIARNPDLQTIPKGHAMPDAEGLSPPQGKLVPAAAEMPRTGRRIRLSKALAATAKARLKETEPAPPGPRRCRLTQAEEAMLDGLKLRLRKIGVDLRKGDLLRAGLHALANFDEARLRDAVAQLDDGGVSGPSQAVS